MKTLEKVIKLNRIRYGLNKFDLDVSYRNRANTEATRIAPSDKQVLLIDSYIQGSSTFVDIPCQNLLIPTKANEFVTQEKIKYVQIIRKPFEERRSHYHRLSVRISTIS